MSNSYMTGGRSKVENRNVGNRGNRGNRLASKVVDDECGTVDKIVQNKAMITSAKAKSKECTSGKYLQDNLLSKDYEVLRPKGIIEKRKKVNLVKMIENARKQLPRQYKALSLEELMEVSNNITANSKKKLDQKEDNSLNIINRVIVLENQIQFPPTKEARIALRKLRLKGK